MDVEGQRRIELGGEHYYGHFAAAAVSSFHNLSIFLLYVLTETAPRSASSPRVFLAGSSPGDKVAQEKVRFSRRHEAAVAGHFCRRLKPI
jgi:hypothetical protein